MSVKDVSDADFDAEVMKSNIPVIVDIWAPWCVSTDSMILKDKRETSFADNINKNDELLSYSGKRVIPSKVLYSKTTSKGGHCKSIMTENDRIVKVTDDHLLYTSKGWKRADSLKLGERVAIYPSAPKLKPSDKKVVNGTILTESDLIKEISTIKKREKYVNQINDLGILPLKYDNQKIYTISRLIGALFSDGCLYKTDKNHYYNAEFFLGQKEDVRELASDLKELGFDFHIKRRVNKFKISGRDITIKTYRIRVSSLAFWALMTSLGVPNGRKTNVKYGLPEWLLKAPIEIKREFISAFLGGDGPNISIKVVSRMGGGFYNGLNINDIEFYKAKDILDSGLDFAKQISLMLEEQGIEVRRIFVDKENYKRKSGGDSKSIHIALSGSFESAYNLASMGYSYSWQKQKNLNYIKEFLEKRLNTRKVWREKYENAVKLFKKDKDSIENISLKLKISSSTIYNWVKRGVKPTVNYTFERYDAWLKDATENLNDGFVWEKIKEINEVYLQKVQVLSIDKYSNFIANGFLVHNCGPCRLYGPIIEDVAKEYEGKVKFVKINADDNQSTVMKFNVSSIPTTLLIKNGQLKAMNVGAVPKEALKKWISQNM